MEKGFGIDTLTLSKPVTEFSSRSAKSSTKNKPIEHSTTGKHPGILNAETNRRTSGETINRPSDQTSVAGEGERIQILEALRNEMLACHKCPLGKTRTHLVFGTGNPEAQLMFVGEAPGRDEDLQGEPFVGRAGQLLTKIIEAIGLKRSDVY
ncbi:MAG: hypothetical protein F9K48_10540, partial [Candidatus Brocadia sp.]